MVSKIKRERQKTAHHRFYVFEMPAGSRQSYRWTVLDAERDPKSVAKFKFQEHAEAFLGLLKTTYVNSEAAEERLKG